MNAKNLFSVLFFLLIGNLTAFADSGVQLDKNSRDLLIDKLQKVYMNLAANDSSKVPVTLRLADLYAERARLDSISELEKGCEVCNAGIEDRKKALKLYLEVADKAPEASRGKVLVQIGHLYQLAGEKEKAQQFYNKIINSNQSPEVKAEAYLSVAEMEFKNHRYQEAKASYKKVLEIESAGSKGLAAYRMAWSSYNLGELDQAITQIETILQSPKLLGRTGENQIDPQFHEEVSRDLATFLARKSPKKADFEALYKLSPEGTRIANVIALANECERVGKKAEALEVWKYIYGYINKPEQKLQSQISSAQLEFDLGQTAPAVEAFDSALKLWKQMGGCGLNQCDESQHRLRAFLVSWNQREKKQPSPELLKSYQGYLALFPQDLEATLWAAEVAKTLKDWDTAWILYSQADVLIAADTKLKDQRESVLLSRIEVAEAGKNDERWTKAQNDYIQNSPSKGKVFEVRYQKAHALYDKAQYKAASEELRTLALDPQGTMTLRKQAADLSLDALVLLKDDAGLLTWSKEYSQVFKNNGGSEFEQIAQKSILTQSANLAKENPRKAYETLLKFDISKAGHDDKVKYLKNKIILAEEIKSFSDARAAVEELLLVKDLNQEDREFALGRKAYFAELNLDFDTALKVTEQIPFKDQEQKYLKLALFAELSGKPSAPYYTQFLKVAQDTESKKAVAAELVRKSKDPVKEIEAQRPVLEKSPELMSRLYSESFAKTSSQALLKRALTDQKIKDTESRKALARVAFLQEFSDLKKKINSSQMDSSTQAKLAKSLKTRAALLETLDKMANQAIQSGDWTSQLVALDLISKESSRFYQEILSAPVPQGLNAEEEQQYLSLLGNQAAPFQTKATQAQAKVDEFWKDTRWAPALQAAWNDSKVRGLLDFEVNALKDIAPEAQKGFFSQLTSETGRTVANASGRPSLQEIESAKQKVRAEPLNRSNVKALLEIERRNEDSSMVQYLETRLKSLSEKEVL